MNQAKKKVLYLITKATWGGAQKYVYDLVTHLPREKFEVEVAYGKRGKLAEKLQEANIKTHRVSSLQRDISFGVDIKSFLELRRLFKTVRPDVVHLNSSKAGGLGALAARLANVKKIILTVHGWPLLERRPILSRVTIWFISWLTALLSHTIICVSDHDVRIAQKMPFVGRKTVRIYNGVAPLQFGSGEMIRNAFPVGVKITGTIGELTKNKNQQALIEEAKNNPTMYVAIVGEGELRIALERKINEYGLQHRVKLFGFMPAPEVLRGFDTFALPSIKEGLPYVLLEARAAGIPIVANRVGGVGEILDAKDLQEFSLEQMVNKTVILYR